MSTTSDEDEAVAEDSVVDKDASRSQRGCGRSLNNGRSSCEPSDGCSCPLCYCSYSNSNSLWQHINLEHISRSHFPAVSFLSAHGRRLCSVCGFAYSAHWKVCRRSQGSGRARCGGVMVDPSSSSWFSKMASEYEQEGVDAVLLDSAHPEDVPGVSNASISGPSAAQACDFDDPVVEAIRAACNLACPVHLESVLFEALMQEISLLPVKTVGHIPCSVRPAVAEALATEFRNATHHGLWGYARLHMFAKAVLRCPPRGGKKKRVIVKAMLLSRLEQWTSGNLLGLWSEARLDADSRKSIFPKSSSVEQANRKRALAYAREGRYREAMRSLGSLGTVNPNNKKAHEELRQRHPAHAVPGHTDEIPSPLSASLDAVLAALQSFPRGSSPGASQLNSQHLLDAIGTTTPSAKHCLENLTCLINFLLSGRADPRIAPWLCGAPLTALLKKQGGIRPIAVGEVLRRLISRLCCSAVKADLPDTFLPYGQVGVGVPGGLDAAIHALSSCIARYGSDPSLCCLKIDMTNAFNECSRVSFLGRLHRVSSPFWMVIMVLSLRKYAILWLFMD